MAAQYYVKGQCAMPTHRPSGAMCRACKHVDADCSPLPFSTMQSMRKDKDGTIVVKCDQFKKGSRG